MALSPWFQSPLAHLSLVEMQERVFFYASVPSYIFGTISVLALIFVIGQRPSLWKPRHIFQALSLFNSLIGIFFGIYGFVFLMERLGYLEPMHTGFFYFFIFHRYLLLSGDMIPSVDRCLAVVWPLKYYTHATTSLALVICILSILAACGLTILAWSLGVIPSYLGQMTYPQFYLLVNSQFVLMLSLPYLSLALVVLICDTRALVIAIGRRRRMSKEIGTTSSFLTTTTSSHHHKREGPASGCGGGGGGRPEEQKIFLDRQPTFEFSNDQSSELEHDHAKRLDRNMIEIKITIRCLATTMWFFISQMCTFLPGIILFGCDDKKDTTDEELEEFEMVEEQCQWILTFWIRIFIFCFYQFQFMKPVFFLAMDKDLRKGLKTLILGDKHQKFAKSKKMIII
ncbi:hypothetical protein TCAL_03686 [Tigriopus californicus]|uniref:G-protein coupled receptors family 1 profile domain-containing protein n=1 Tax=Tigriopus californicus TaxID=6832 RepID=A0A553N733_TIGCA|nr:uncharacterized protein LOC131884439 isoform X1 [Tigriopus californicus]TRY61210.1 hypothetical protein TCAL_03686 [Tigriopus californicus]